MELPDRKLVARLRERGEHHSIFEAESGQLYVSASEHGAENIVTQWEYIDWTETDAEIAANLAVAIEQEEDEGQ